MNELIDFDLDAEVLSIGQRIVVLGPLWLQENGFYVGIRWTGNAMQQAKDTYY